MVPGQLSGKSGFGIALVREVRGKENDKGMGGWGDKRVNIAFSERRTSVTRTTAATNAVGNFAAAEALAFEIFLLTL